MTILEIEKTRYSVRKYKQTPVAEQLIDQLITAAWVSPTAANQQPYRLLVLKEKESLSKLKKATPSHHGAPLAIIVLGHHQETWVRPFDQKKMTDIDASIVTTQIMLTATELGLGSCWVTYFDPKVIRAEFNLPDYLEPINILTLGYADEPPLSANRHTQTRRSKKELIFFDSLH